MNALSAHTKTIVDKNKKCAKDTTLDVPTTADYVGSHQIGASFNSFNFNFAAIFFHVKHWGKRGYINWLITINYNYNYIIKANYM